ncbi:hypothetical protein DPEC_G00227030 [Dallia pectoralis]|uniref:Uncharacterized protein n=1 Tax=Dallia pectoralis TaxID=75939 RepID=A0ACC2G174_DALPE|nr:hypothetical protein DPEC_G00227030 [Dallia pectoralis]
MRRLICFGGSIEADLRGGGSSGPHREDTGAFPGASLLRTEPRVKGFPWQPHPPHLTLASLRRGDAALTTPAGRTAESRSAASSARVHGTHRPCNAARCLNRALLAADWLIHVARDAVQSMPLWSFHWSLYSWASITKLDLVFHYALLFIYNMFLCMTERDR